MTARVVAAALIGIVIMSGAASAQTPSDPIQQNVKPGQQIAVVDEQGRRFRGRVVDVSADSLTLAKGRDRTTVPHRSVVRIDLVDDLKKGTRIGLIVGGGFFAVEALYAREAGFTANAALYAAGAALYCGAGAAIGAGIDALIGGDRRLYQRSGASAFSVAPVLGRGRVGAVVGIAW